MVSTAIVAGESTGGGRCYFNDPGSGFDDFEGLGIEKLMEYASLFGFGDVFGIDLPSEGDGFLPSKEWKEEMAILGLPLATKDRARYLAWIKGMACPLEEDIEILMELIGQHTGVSEADTAEAVERFRRIEGGNTD